MNFCATNEQIADIFTKALNREQFEKNRLELGLIKANWACLISPQRLSSKRFFRSYILIHWMQSTYVLKLAHVWITTCWQSLRSDDIAFIVLRCQTTDGKNTYQEQVWPLFVNLCKSGSSSLSCWTFIFFFPKATEIFSPIFLSVKPPKQFSLSLSQRIHLPLTFFLLKNFKP